MSTDPFTIELNLKEAELLMTLFRITTVCDLFDALGRKMGDDRKKIDETAQGLVALASKLDKGIEDYVAGN